jgi:uncharacterized SAM-binding protein YcdF (DUF218 family)
LSPQRAGALVLAVLGAGIAAVASRPPAERPPAALHADAALVLSGDVDYVRVKHAAALVNSGQARAMLLTGRGIGGDSAEEMRKIALADGVPEAAIVLERESTTTRENLLFAAPIVKDRGWRRVALVTSQSHLARALAAARKAMPEVEWVPAPVIDAGPAARVRRQRAEEPLKHLWYILRGWA